MPKIKLEPNPVTAARLAGRLDAKHFNQISGGG